MTTLRAFEPGDAAAFRQLNEEWIRQSFGLEEQDRRMLDDPQGSILNRGGHIFLAVDGDAVVGCCALIPMDDDVWELAKMTVAVSHRRRGIGRQLMECAIGKARERRARALFLGSNTTLQAAIRLYEAFGFEHLPPERWPHSPYARANVFMRLELMKQ